MKRTLSFSLITLSMLAACGPDQAGSGDQNGEPWIQNNATPNNTGNTAANTAANTATNNQTSPPNNTSIGNTGSGENTIPNASLPMCGDGVRQGGELCDGDCPADASACPAPPPDACSRLTYEGSPAQCNAVCGIEVITACVDDDGCCQPSCAGMDSDCDGEPMTCGNGMLDEGESCDGDCPGEQSDCPVAADACSTITFQGDAAACTATCSESRVIACIDNDDCCPQGCGAMDSDCVVAPMCGNNIVEDGELCDGSCPTSAASCDDMNVCTADSVSGVACQSSCENTPVSLCVGGDGCCPAGCEQMDSDCVETDQCGATIVSNAYSGASIVSTLAIESDSCCFDFTGDGVVDNSLGGTLDSLGSLVGFTRQDANSAIQQSIDSGDFALVLEHDGQIGFTTSPPYTTHIYEAQPQCFATPGVQGGNVYKLNPSSFDAAGQPLYALAQTMLAQGQISASGGVLPFTLSFFGTQISVPISALKLSATVDATNSALPDKGVALNGGKLGGIIKVTDFYGGLNKAAAQCACYNNPGNVPLISYTNVSDGSCNTINASMCPSGGPCEQLESNCSLLVSIMPSLADVDSNAVGSGCDGAGRTCDAVSVGLSFSAYGARIQ